MMVASGESLSRPVIELIQALAPRGGADHIAPDAKESVGIQTEEAVGNLVGVIYRAPHDCTHLPDIRYYLGNYRAASSLPVSPALALAVLFHAGRPRSVPQHRPQALHDAGRYDPDRLCLLPQQHRGEGGQSTRHFGHLVGAVSVVLPQLVVQPGVAAHVSARLNEDVPAFDLLRG